MMFGKHMGTLEGHLYDVWEVYGDPIGSYGTVYMMFGECMWTLWVIWDYLYDVWGVYVDTRGHMGLFGECMWTLEIIGALILGLGRVLGL